MTTTACQCHVSSSCRRCCQNSRPIQLCRFSRTKTVRPPASQTHWSRRHLDSDGSSCCCQCHRRLRNGQQCPCFDLYNVDADARNTSTAVRYSAFYRRRRHVSVRARAAVAAAVTCFDDVCEHFFMCLPTHLAVLPDEHSRRNIGET